MNCTIRTKPRSRTAFRTYPSFGAEQLFRRGNWGRDVGHTGEYIHKPAVNVLSYDNRIELKVALPGLTKDKVKIDVDNDLLTISTSKKTEEGSVNYRLREIKTGDFKRVFKLDDALDTGKVDASFEHGILSITIHKKEEVIPQPARKINIS